MKTEKIERMKKINELIEVIANTDRQFFNHKDCKDGEISHFVNENKLFFVDGYTHDKIYPYNNSKWDGFSEGGTLIGLVKDFRAWIINGTDSNGKNGYSGLYSTSWGYSIDGMDKIISKAKEIGYLSKEKPSFREVCLKIKEEGHGWYLCHSIKAELGIDN